MDDTKAEGRERRRQGMRDTCRGRRWCMFTVIAVASVAVIIYYAIASTYAKSTGKASYRGDSMVRAFPSSEKDINFLRNFSQAGVDASVWGLPVNKDVPVYIYAKSGALLKLRQVLDQQGIEYFILFEDLQSLIDKESQALTARKSSRSVEDFDYETYHPLNEIYSLLDSLAAKSTLIQLSKLGATNEGRDLKLVKISTDHEAGRPIIYFNCGIHAREWISHAVCLSMIQQLSNESVDDETGKLRNTFDWWFVPVANPDGYTYSWEQDRMWRKNRSPPPADSNTCWGVDLNRNFDAAFNQTPRDPCSNSYGGPSAFSEVETRTIQDLLSENKERVKTAVFMHSFSQLWLSPYGVNGTDPEDFPEMIRVMKRAVKALTDTHGTEYQFGSIANTLYGAEGTAVDYCYDTLGIIYCFLIELPDQGKRGFVLPLEKIAPTFQETWNGIKEMAKAVAEKL